MFFFPPSHPIEVRPLSTPFNGELGEKGLKARFHKGWRAGKDIKRGGEAKRTLKEGVGGIRYKKGVGQNAYLRGKDK
jgi:hypothetical protein